LEALKSLKVPVDQWDDILVAIINTKLDYYTKKDWEQTLAKDRAKLHELKNFIEKRCQFLESVAATNRSQTPQNSHNNKFQSYQKGRSAVKVTTHGDKAITCNQSHNLHQCAEFLALSVRERKTFVKGNKLCFNCLKNNHQVGNCKSSHVCKECKGKHHSLLHMNSQSTTEVETSSVSNTSASLFVNTTKSVLLPMAIVKLKDKFNQRHYCRALLDVGSQSHFITEKRFKKLGLRAQKTNLTIVGVSDSKHNTSRCTVLYQNYAAQIQCFIVPKITTDLPLQSFEPSRVKIPNHIQLADPEFYKSNSIDLSISSEIFWNLLLPNHITESSDRPHFQETRLGWIAGGTKNTSHNKALTSCHRTAVSDLESEVAKFWAIEELGNKMTMPNDDMGCENHFVNSYRRLTDGRFEVSLPFKNNPINLGRS
jgi:hypothetical protein